MRWECGHVRRLCLSIKDIVVGVTGLIAIIAHDVSDRSEPVGVPAVHVIDAAGASFEELMLVFETRTVRGDATKEMGTVIDGVVEGRL